MQAGLQGRSNATLLAAVIGTSISTALLTLLSGMSLCHLKSAVPAACRLGARLRSTPRAACLAQPRAPKWRNIPQRNSLTHVAQRPYHSSVSLPTLTPKPHAWRAGVLGFLLLRRPRQKRLAADAEGCGGKALSSVETPMACSFSSGAGASTPEAKKAALLRSETLESSERLVRPPFAEGGASTPEAKRTAQRHLQAPDGPGTLIGSSDKAPKAAPRCVQAPQEGLVKTETRISGGSSLSGAGGALTSKAKEVVSSPEPEGGRAAAVLARGQSGDPIRVSLGGEEGGRAWAPNPGQLGDPGQGCPQVQEGLPPRASCAPRTARRP